MGRDGEFKIRCSRCRHWLANASGGTFSLELKCPKCCKVTRVRVTSGSIVVETALDGRRVAEAVA